MKNAIYSVIAMTILLPSDETVAADPYGGNRSTTRMATGFFRLDDVDGRHFLITPEGHPFRALGLNHFRMIQSRDHDRALQNLRGWGFNSGGYHAPPWQWNHIPHTRGIHLVPSSSWRPPGQFAFRDVFDAEFLKELEQKIRRTVESSRENPFLVGYFWTDIPTWERKRDLRSAKGGPFWGQDWISFYKGLPEAAAGRKVWEAWRSENPEAAEKAFLAVIARQLYSNAHAMMRKVDTNHLILGDRYFESDMPEHVVREALPYIDVIAIQPTTRTFDAEYFTEITKRYGKPIYIADHVSSFRTTEHPNTMAQAADDPESYIAHYTKYVTSALSHPSVIGFNKCLFNDPKPEMAYMQPISFVDIKHAQTDVPDSNFRDIFSPEFEQHCDRLAKEIALPIKDDPFLLGYAMTDCTMFTEEDLRERTDTIGGARRKSRIGWPRRLRNMGAEAAGKKAYVQTMRDLYRDSIEDFNKTYGAQFDSFDGLAAAETWRPQTQLSNAHENRTHASRMADIDRPSRRFRNNARCGG